MSSRQARGAVRIVWVDTETADIHVHVGCTSGDFPAPIALDENGRFSVAGSYHLRLYPVAFGPTVPAQFAGVVNGNRLTFTVAVNDTVEKKLVVLGPAIVTFGPPTTDGTVPDLHRRDASGACYPAVASEATGRSRTRSAG